MITSVAADQLLTSLLERSFQRALTSGNSALLASLSAASDGTAGLSAAQLVAVLGGTRSSLLGLGSSAAKLDAANPLSVFFTGAATTTDSSVATVRVIPGSSAYTAPAAGSYRITVQQVAVAQVNQGTALGSTATSSFAPGTNTVRITQNGTTTDVSFTVGATDTNATVLTSLADAINATSGLGVTAAVITDDTAGTSQLAITATATGTSNAFTLSNVAGTPVTDAGLGTATTAAANAIYVVDGTTYTQSSNEVYLGPTAKVHVTLVGASTTPVVVTVGPDTQEVTTAVVGLVSDYNDAHAFFASNPDALSGVAQQLASVVSRNSARLRAIGISVAADGSLSVDTGRLASVLENSPSTVRDVLGDAGGVAKEIRAIADTQLAIPAIARNPLPPFQPGTVVRTLAGAYAARVSRLALRGSLVDALL